MKNLLFLVLVLCVTGIAVAQDGEFHLDKIYKVNKNGTIDLSSSDAKVFITGSLRPDVRVKIDRKVDAKGLWSSSREEFRVEIDELNGDLRIKEYQSSNQSGVITYYNEEYRIEIEAPEGMTLNIRGDDGDYFIKNVNGAISMSIDDADAQLNNCNGTKFSFRVDDGDVRMDKGAGSLMVEADDADVHVYKGKFTSIDAKLDDGELVVQTSLANNGDYRITCQDGFVSLDITDGGGEFEIRHDDGHITTNGNFKTTYESEDETRVTLAAGNARVSVRGDDTRIKLTAR